MNPAAPMPLDVRLMNAVSALLAAALLATVAWGTIRWVVRLPAFNFRAIQVEGDVSRNSAASLRANALPRLHGSFLGMNLKEGRAAFEAVFQRGTVNVHPERVRRLHSGDCAIHHVLERVQLHADDKTAAPTAWVIATNVYLKTALGWRLVLHHASPGSAGDVQELVADAGTLH